MKMKICLFALTLFLLTSLLFVTPAAAGGWTDVNTAWLADHKYELQNGNYRLTEDIALPKTLVIVNPAVELDLNGHTLALTKETDHVITIDNYGSLTLSDSRSTGKITGLKNSNGDHIGECGGGINLLSGTFIMNGGTIYECTAHQGGGVYVASGCQFIMNGGTINSCYAVQGAGIYNEGKTTINGGAIVNTGKSLKYEVSLREYSAQFGGGIYNAGIMTINDCTILNCHAKQGGGIYNAARELTETVLVINGGSISEGLTDFHNGGDDLYTTAPVLLTGGYMEDSVFLKETEIDIRGPALILGEITLVGSTIYLSDSWIGYTRPGYLFDGWYRDYNGEYFVFDEQKIGPWEYYAVSDKIIARWTGSGVSTPVKTATPASTEVSTTVPTLPPTMTPTPVVTNTPVPTVEPTVQPTVLHTVMPTAAVTAYMPPEPLPTFTLLPTEAVPPNPSTPLPLAGLLLGCAAAFFVCRRN